MSPRPTSRSHDLQRLRNEGFEISVVDGHLVVDSIPYVTADRTVASGRLISTLTLSGDETTTPDSHVVYFAGSTPCSASGEPLHELINSPGPIGLSPNITADFMFSHKPVPSGAYEDYHAKITTYATILLQHAQEIDPDVSPRTFAPVVDDSDTSVFRYADTATARAGIALAASRLDIGKVAIVGVGGTGAYILDLLAKTPIHELHLFDADEFLQHNAFRTPGAPSIEQLQQKRPKVDHLAGQYAPMRTGIVPHPVAIDESNVSELTQMDFVFIAIDDGAAKGCILDHLETHDIAFIDVGMGLYERGGALGGLVRTTFSGPDAQSRRAARERISLGTGVSEEYGQNIQIAELNALNAALAVIRFKQFLGFYLDHSQAGTSIYMVDSNAVANEDRSEQ